jgi:integrase
MLRQRDGIGEWVPETEPGKSEVTWRGMKWLRGIRWEEVTDDLILEHVTSKRQKKVEIDLKLAPMVMIELQSAYCELGEPLTRARLPKSGPIIIDEETGYPYLAHTFRRTWRRVARAAGVPDTVKNMHSRHGAISEATDAGADLEHIRHAATHSDIGMTQRYSHNSADKTARVQQQRVAHRAVNRGR